MKTDGPAIITEGRLVNILCDFQAFDAIPASKYVMRAIIDDGYSKKLLQCAKWDMNAQQLSGQFANSTGFQLDIVWLIFQSIAYGLGWTNSIVPRPNDPSSPQIYPQNSQKPKLGKKPSISDINNYFSSIIERIPETEHEFNIEFTNITCVWDNSFEVKDFYYNCNIEVRGKLSRGMTIKVITYGENNTIMDVNRQSVSCEKQKSFGVYNFYLHIKGCNPSELSKILVYAE